MKKTPCLYDAQDDICPQGWIARAKPTTKLTSIESLDAFMKDPKQLALVEEYAGFVIDRESLSDDLIPEIMEQATNLHEHTNIISSEKYPIIDQILDYNTKNPWGSLNGTKKDELIEECIQEMQKIMILLCAPHWNMLGYSFGAEFFHNHDGNRSIDVAYEKTKIKLLTAKALDLRDAYEAHPFKPERHIWTSDGLAQYFSDQVINNLRENSPLARHYDVIALGRSWQDKAFRSFVNPLDVSPNQKEEANYIGRTYAQYIQSHMPVYPIDLETIGIISMHPHLKHALDTRNLILGVMRGREESNAAFRAPFTTEREKEIQARINALEKKWAAAI